jgi:hypothetical protein
MELGKSHSVDFIVNMHIPDTESKNSYLRKGTDVLYRLLGYHLVCFLFRTKSGKTVP